MKVNLNDVIEAIEFEGELLTHYYNKKTGVIIYLEDLSTANYKAEDFNNLESFEEWEQELIKDLYDLKEKPNDYIQLPNKDEINEHKMIVEFCNSIDSLKLDEELSISELREHIQKKGYLNEWYDYREKAEYRLAVYWCKKNNIEVM